MREALIPSVAAVLLLAAAFGCGDDDGSSGEGSTAAHSAGGGAAQPGSLHARFVGHWEGTLGGSAGRQLELAELAAQEQPPSAQQLAELSEAEREKLQDERRELAKASPQQAELSKGILRQMQSVYADLELEVDANELTFRMGSGREPRTARYEVLGQEDSALRIRSTGEGGRSQERTLVFEDDDTFRMKMDTGRGREVTLRFTRLR